MQPLIDGRRTRAPKKPSERNADERQVIALFDPFVLRGLIMCGTCGKTMSPSMSEATTPKLVREYPLPQQHRRQHVLGQIQGGADLDERFARLGEKANYEATLRERIPKFHDRLTIRVDFPSK